MEFVNSESIEFETRNINSKIITPPKVDFSKAPYLFIFKILYSNQT